MNIRTIAAGLACCMTLGCATRQGTAALECGAGGAGASYLLCKALGGKDDTCKGMAVAGAGVGAVACYQYAGNLEKRRQELAGQENNLDARIAYVRGLNRDAEQLNEQLRTRVADATRRTDDAVRKLNAGTLTQEQRQQERARLDSELAASQREVALARDALGDMKRFQARQARASRALDTEIVKQQRLLTEAERQTSAMAAQRRRV